MSEESNEIEVKGIRPINTENSSYGDYLKFLIEANIITVAEARATIGLSSEEADDVSYSKFKHNEAASRPRRTSRVTSQRFNPY